MKKKGTAGEVIFQIANYTIFGLFTLICILPVLTPTHTILKKI